jgi:hypothetical protein
LNNTRRCRLAFCLTPSSSLLECGVIIESPKNQDRPTIWFLGGSFGSIRNGTASRNDKKRVYSLRIFKSCTHIILRHEIHSTKTSQTMTLWRSPLRLFFLFALFSVAFGDVISKTVSLNGFGELRYHIDNGSASGDPRLRQTVMLLCVGTAMGVAGYDLISGQIIKASPGIIVILLDPTPRWPIKLDSKKFARLVEATKEQLPTFFPTSSFNDSRIIIGGHSAGGKAAIGALSLLSFTPVGYFGLDPFPVDSSLNITIPTMIWYVLVPNVVST